MKKVLLLLALAVSMAVSAATTVGVQNQKILLNQDGTTTLLAPNGQDDSYYWVSLSPDGTRILYSSAHHGTNICDLEGNIVSQLGRLNAPKWLDNTNVSGMQEHYSDTEHDLVDHIDYYGINLKTMDRRALTKAEVKEFIRLEEVSMEAYREAAAARAAERRTMMGNSLQGLKIYVNAGHGGHDPNDRSCWTIPIPETWTNPNGYWESNSNLVKALALRDLLEAAGATVIMSRVTNNSGSRDIQYYSYAAGTPEYNAIMAGDDRDLSAIAQEANANNVDHFLSIHSNALNGMTNYLLLLYHGENGRPTVATSDVMAAASGEIQKQNNLTVWTTSGALIRGDITFYGDSPNDPLAGLGVLRPLTVPGFLSEGSFHDYPPETHRLCNADYCKVEAIRFFQHFHRYFGRTLPQTATIAGWVKSQNEKVDVLNQPKFYYVPGSDDQWLPLNGAKIVLKNASGQRIDSLTTDNWYNGYFAFYDLQPGTYQVEASLHGYKTMTQSVTVAAEDIAQVKMRIKNTHMDVPDYEEPEQDAGTMPLSQYDFEADGNPTAQSGTYTRVIYKKGKMITLGSEGIILRKWDFTALDTIPMPAGVTIADIALTADGYLVGSVPGNGTMTLYAWDDEFRNPAVFFTENGITGQVGTTIATSGPLWKVKVFTAAGDHIYSIQYNENQAANVVTEEKTISGTNDDLRLTVTPEGVPFPDAFTIPAYFRYANQSYMVRTYASPASFDVEEITGPSSFHGVSAFYNMDGSDTKAMAVAYVDGYTIHVGILAQDNAGNARYGTWKSIVTPVADIYANEVKFDGTNFSFRLNEDATSVFLSIEKEGEMKSSHDLGAMTKGAHTVPNPFGTESFDAFSITATARSVGYPVKISDDDAAIFQFYNPMGVAVDRTPTSPFFGRVYVAESAAGKSRAGRRTTRGVYMLSSDLTDIGNQSDYAYSGRVQWGADASSNYQYGLGRFSVAPSGKVFLTSSSFSSAGVYVMDPASPTTAFKPVFEGYRNTDTGALTKSGKTITDPVMSCVVLGEGADEKLYTMARNNTGTAYCNLCQYNIGELDSLPWKAVPTTVIYDDRAKCYMENGSGQLAYDGRGGWFMSQYRFSSTEGKPSLIHISNGDIDHNYGTEIATSQQGGMAVSADGSLIALGREPGYVAVYDVDYDSDTYPVISEKYVINWGSGATMALDFDVAGNLYIAGNGRLMVYALPKTINSFTTRIPYRYGDTNVSNVKEDANVQKVIRGGQVLIIKNGRTFNALGQELK